VGVVKPLVNQEPWFIFLCLYWSACVYVCECLFSRVCVCSACSECFVSQSQKSIDWCNRSITTPLVHSLTSTSYIDLAVHHSSIALNRSHQYWYSLRCCRRYSDVDDYYRRKSLFAKAGL